MKEPYNFLIISSFFPPGGSGGVATHVDYLATALNGLKKKYYPHYTRVISTHNLGDDIGPQKEKKRHKLCIHRLQGQENHFNAKGSVPYEKVIKFCLGLCNRQRSRPDIIHVHDFVGIHIASLIKAIYDIPIVFTVHKAPKEWDNAQIYFDPKNFHLQALKRISLVDKFVAPSSAYAKHLRDHGIEKSKISIIPHGIPAGNFKAISDPNAFKKLNLSIDIDGSHQKKKIIFAPIRIDKHKGPDVFIEAADYLINEWKHKNLLFVIPGNGKPKYKSKLFREISSCNLEDCFILGTSDNVGLNQAEMSYMYSKSSICVMPSRREGFGQSIIEAFLYKKPVVASNVGGIRDIIDSESNGLFSHRDEPEHLARQIERLIIEERLPKRIAENAKKCFDEKYNARIMAKSYFNFYKEIIDNPKRNVRKKQRAGALIN